MLILSKNIVLESIFHNEIEEDYNICIEKFQNQIQYEGCYKRNMRNGIGTFYFKDGSIYQGEWVDNEICGYVFLKFYLGYIYFYKIKLLHSRKI
jgi:hypothetical protein